jgi:uncharacterized membrane protein YagU involved in acid resistance
MRNPWRTRRNAAKGLAAGMIGGLAATWVMTRFGEGVTRLTSRRAARESEPLREQALGGGPRPDAPHLPSRDRSSAESQEPATVKAATAVAEQVFHRELTPQQKPAAGAVVHYAFGTLTGGLYGTAAEYWQPLRAGGGTLFGTVFWALSDELAVPALGLAKGPRAYSLGVHSKALASHIVYGATAELIRRTLRKTVLS